ncbi:MAG: hypothetical protein IT536_16780 [Hyphomicrobiales bacterium]|nr:hypothetical protein [Hyphomicrobiales bacterium]
MSLLVTFALTFTMGAAVVVAAAGLVEMVSKSISLFVFLILYFGMIPLAWRIAVRLTEPKVGDRDTPERASAASRPR